MLSRSISFIQLFGFEFRWAVDPLHISLKDSKIEDRRPELDATSNTLLVRPFLANTSLLSAISMLPRRFDTTDLIILKKNSDASIVFSAMTHANDNGRLLHHLSAVSLITKVYIRIGWYLLQASLTNSFVTSFRDSQ